MQPSSQRFLYTGAACFLVIVLIGLWLLPITVQIGANQANTTHTISTASVSSPDSSLVRQSGVTIRLIESAHPSLDAALIQQLQERLNGRLPGIRILTDQETPAVQDGVPTPILLIEMTHSAITWTPVTANAQITAAILYASDGDISWRDDASMVMPTVHAPTVHARGTLELTDSAQGLWSQFGYQQRLGVTLGDEVFKMIESPLFEPPGS